MAFGYWDIAKIVVPVAAGIVGTPAAGIAAAAAMNAGEGVAKGEGVEGALKRGAIGAGTQAIGGGAGKALGGLLTKGAAEGTGTVLADIGTNSVLKPGATLAKEAAKQRFAGHALDLGQEAMGAYGEHQQGKASFQQQLEEMNAMSMADKRKGGGFQNVEQWVPSYRRY